MLFLCCISMMYAVDYPILVKGVRVTSSNASNVLSDGTVRYVAASNTLEFTNANISRLGNALTVEEGFTGVLNVTFKGKNYFTNTGTSNAVISFNGSGTLSLNGGGSLEIKGGQSGIYLYNTAASLMLKTFDCTITAPSEYGIYSKNKIDINNSTLVITDFGRYGIFHNVSAGNDLVIEQYSDVTIDASASGSGVEYGIFTNSKPSITNNSKLTITTPNAKGAFYSSNQPTLSGVHVATNPGDVASNASYYSTLKGFSYSGSVLVKKLNILPGEYYNFKVDEVEVTSLNKDEILGSGNYTARYSPSSNTLTLNGVNLSSSVNAINLGKSLTINVVGANQITSSKSAIYSNQPFEITGTGIFHLTSTSLNEVYAPVRIENSTSTMTVSGGLSVNLYGEKYGMYGGKLNVKKSELYVRGKTAAFKDLYGITFDETQIVRMLSGDNSVYNSKKEDGSYNLVYDSSTRNVKNTSDPYFGISNAVTIGYRLLGVKIGETFVNINNFNDILGDGKVRYEESTNTLYLNNATIESPESPICNETRKEFNICCSGTNTLKNTFNDPYFNSVISSNSAVNIYGSNNNASLLIEGSDGATYGICSSSPNDFSIPVNIRDIKLDMRTHANSSLAITCEYFNISNAQVYITSIGKNTWGIAGGDKQRSICNNSIISIKGYGQGATGIMANLEISNSVVDIYADAGTITYFGESGLTLTDEYIVSPTEDLSSSYQFVGKYDIYNILLHGEFAPSVHFRPGTFYGLRIDGVDVTSNNKADIFNDGKASFSPIDNTLTLNGINRESGTNGLVVGEERDGMTISLVGENKLSSYGHVLETNCDVEITDNGTLYLACLDSIVRHYPIYCHDHDLAVTNGATVTTLMPERARFGLYDCSELLVDNAYVNLAGKEGAADSLSSIDLKDDIFINKVSLDGVKYEDASDEVGLNFFKFYNDAHGDCRNSCYGVKIGPKEYEGIKIAGVAIDRINKNDILGNGKVKFDPETYTLTFDNAYIMEDDIESCISIKNPGRDVTIATVGKCTFSGERYGLYVQDANVTIKGQSLEESDQVSFYGGTAASSVMVSSEENTSNLTFDNSFTYFLGKYWGIIGGPFSTLTFVNSKCHCCGEGTSEGAGSLRGFKQINYAGHEINKINPAVIKGGTAYDPSGTNVLRAAWIMIEPKAASSDIDGDGTTDVKDVIRLRDIVLGKRQAPATADLNGDGKVDILDIVLLNEMLKVKK